MKRRTSTALALALATLGSVVILGATALIAFGTLFLGSLGNVDCQNCHDLRGVFFSSWLIGGIGLVLAIIAFWGIYRSMRPPRK